MNTCPVEQSLRSYLREEDRREAEHERLMDRTEELTGEWEWVSDTLFDRCPGHDMSGFFARDISPMQETVAKLLTRPTLTDEQMRTVIEGIRESLAAAAYSQAESEEY